MHEDIILLNAFLQIGNQTQSESSFSKAVLTARGFIARAVLPNGDFAEKSPYDGLWYPFLSASRFDLLLTFPWSKKRYGTLTIMDVSL